jgi:exonuclease VII small subunit
MTTGEPGDGAVPVTELSYTEASRELDAIVGFFEQREVDVDQLVIRLERATAIVDELDRRVRKTRAQVEELVPRLEAVNRGAVGDGADASTGHHVDDDVEDELREIDEVDMLDDPRGAEDDAEGEDQALF